jgi:hypothetical protein
MRGLTRPELRALCSAWRERGLLQGDLNRVQSFLLAWTLGEGLRESYDIETDRFKGQLFVSNPEMYARMFPEEFRSGPSDWIGAEDEPGLRAAGMM